MKKIVVVLGTLIYSSFSFAQTNLAIQEKKTRFGFNFGTGYSILKPMEKSTEDQLKIENGGSFRLGIMMKHQLSKKFAISPKSELSFTNSQFRSKTTSGEVISNSVYNTSIEFMAHLEMARTDWKLKPYIFAGPSLRVPLNKKDETNYNSSYDIGLDIGYGLNKGFTYFNLYPEIRFSTGFKNLMNDQSLPKMRYNSIALILNFGG